MAVLGSGHLMKLRCYALRHDPPPIVPASHTRDWMDRFPDRHAYRCLPLNIANAHGWEVQFPCDLTIHWDGGEGVEAITFEAPGYPHLDHLVHTNFSRGIVTFLPGYLFVTEPGWNLLVMGPTNVPRDGIAALTGIIETDWLPYPFTMNWQFTRPGTVRFLKGDPFCVIFPIRKDELEAVEVEIYDLADAPELSKQYETWKQKRTEFKAGRQAGDPGVLRERWQKYYFKGILPETDEVIAGHKQKLRLRAPLDRRRK